MRRLVRKCAKCGGTVSHHHETFPVEVPARDERGRLIEEWKTDKESGQKKMTIRMVKSQGRGLGQWTCNRGCKPTRVQTNVQQKPA